MIDKNSRKLLAKNLKDLVEGTITTDQFCFSKPKSENDRAVDSIWAFGDSLYSDATEYTLQGKYAVRGISCDLAQRCILFLETDLEYMWPDQPKSAVGYMIPVCFLWIINIILINFSGSLKYLILPALALFAANLFFTVTFCFYLKYQQRKQADCFWKASDKDAWPFWSQSDLENAKSTQKKSQGKGQNFN